MVLVCILRKTINFNTYNRKIHIKAKTFNSNSLDIGTRKMQNVHYIKLNGKQEREQKGTFGSIIRNKQSALCHELE